MRTQALRISALLVFAGAPAARAEAVKILQWDILTYDAPESAAYQALKRVVQAVNPDIILFEEAQDLANRAQFVADFGARYPYGFLGDPDNGHARNQIWSAYPLTDTGQIQTSDPNGGLFERPTIWADVDVLANQPGAELRVYCAHYEPGSNYRETQLRLAQAIDDANHIANPLFSKPGIRIVYAGNLNAEPGDPPLFKLIESRTTLARLALVDPNTGSQATRVSTKVIDHIYRSSTLNGFISGCVFRTDTYAPGALPPPAQLADTLTASDHFSLVAAVDVRPLMINEVFLRQAGTADTQEFIELYGGQSLTGFSVVSIEGDASENPGVVDKVWKLDQKSIGAGGYYVLGDTAIAPDTNIGTQNILENGTQTILLLQSCTLTAGQDIDPDDDGVAEVTNPGTIYDRVAFTTGIPDEWTYYNAPVVPAWGDGAAPGACRYPNARTTGGAGDWVALSLTTDGRDGGAAITPKAANRSLAPDFDNDGDVDANDVTQFVACLGGPGAGIQPGCSKADINIDGEVDMDDFGLLQRRLTAPR